MRTISRRSRHVKGDRLCRFFRYLIVSTLVFLLVCMIIAVVALRSITAP